MNFEDGSEVGIPAIVKFGGVYYLSDRKIALLLDSDSYISQQKPTAYHAGLEWKLLPFLAIRVGMDQMSGNVQVDNNLTAGVGINYNGFTFDYAYHQYGDIEENTTHYFSLGYVGVEKPEEKEEVKPREEVKPVPKVKLVTFKDVPEGYWAKDAIERLATAGVITGYPDGTFRPERTLSRAELCTLLIRAKGISAKAPGRPPFSDVSVGHWAAGFIKESADMQLVNGYPDGTFKPNNPLTRAETVKILTLFDGLKIEAVKEKPFTDVSVVHWAAPYINAAKNAGFIGYIKEPTFAPKRDLTRAEAAWILSKTGFVKQKYPDLF
jgi:hypothetical protein